MTICGEVGRAVPAILAQSVLSLAQSKRRVAYRTIDPLVLGATQPPKAMQPRSLTNAIERQKTAQKYSGVRRI